METIDKRIDNLQEQQNSKITMRSEILGQISKYIADAENDLLTAAEFKAKVGVAYTQAKSKYGELVRLK